MSHKKKARRLQKELDRVSAECVELYQGFLKEADHASKTIGTLQRENKAVWGANAQLKDEVDLWKAEVDSLHAQVAEQQEVMHNWDHIATQRAQREELVQTAETVARTAGNRMDALERFYNDLLAGEYDRPGSFPDPSIPAEDEQ